MNYARTAYWKSVAGEGDPDERLRNAAAACSAFLGLRSIQARRRMEELRPEYEAAIGAQVIRDDLSPMVRAQRLFGHAQLAPYGFGFGDEWFASICINERRRTA